ncbi:MAG: hypothetical protein WC454_07875 [Phycisphaerae bacterium]
MSWGINAPCWNCKKRLTCNDNQHVQEGINTAHQDTAGHQGGGTVVMACSRMVEGQPDCPDQVQETVE